MIAGTVGLLTVALAIWLWLSEPRRWVRRLGWVAVAAVLLQAILGGITVLYKLPPAVVISHACLAQAFFCLTLSLAVFTGRRWNVELPLVPDSPAPSFRQLTAATSVVLFLQLALGAGLRHQVTNVVPHLIGAIAVCLMIGWVILRAMTIPEQKPLQQLGITMGFLLILQVGLGGLSYFTRLVQLERSSLDAVMIWTTSAHVAVGALLLGTSWVLTLYAFRRMAPAKAVASFSQNPQKSPA
jgi:cytochrome c oxidase assembly protein subunit 15